MEPAAHQTGEHSFGCLPPHRRRSRLSNDASAYLIANKNNGNLDFAPSLGNQDSRESGLKTKDEFAIYPMFWFYEKL